MTDIADPGEHSPLSSWLALREPADIAARSVALTDALRDVLAHRRPLRAVDLGTGRGSNIRYLSARVAGPQEWLAVDHDPALLREALAAGDGERVQVRTWMANLGEERPEEIFGGRDLVTGSALLDLVSAGWLDWLAASCHAARAHALFTITYNGRNLPSPADPDDATVFAWFNQHQLTDKGLGGRAAGPAAVEEATRAFVARGFEVAVAPSDWHLDSSFATLQALLIDGWAHAAAEIAPAESVRIEAWRQRRRAHVDAGRSSIEVGHDDLLALFR